MQVQMYAGCDKVVQVIESLSHVLEVVCAFVSTTFTVA